MEWQGEVRQVKDIKEKKMELAIASIRVPDTYKEKMAHFAHEGLPYMVELDNWIDFNDQFTVNIWWNDAEQTYRATAYMKMGGQPYIEKGIDLF